MGLFARIKALWYALLNQSVAEMEDKHVIALAEARLQQATEKLKDAGLEKELQELVAVREATDPAFIPEPLRALYASPEKAGALERRIQEILALLGTASR